MRDPKRIHEVLEILDRLWKRYPDTRFNQLIHSFQMEFHAKTGGGIYCLSPEREGSAYDLFYVEDDVFLDFLKQKLEEEL